MQEYITEDTLKTLGINLEGKDVESLLAHLNDTVEERVGVEITESLDEAKLAELVELQEKASEEDLGAWLSANVPELDAIVSDNVDIVLGDLATNADGINEVK